MKANLTELHTALEETFGANFVSYYRAHVAHVNIQSRTFYQDHKLLQKIYEYFQANIDTLAEKIRTCRAFMPTSLGTVIGVSPIMDMDCEGDSLELLGLVLEDLEAMIDQYHALNDAAEAVNYIDISNYAQDQIGIIARFRWMVESTLDERKEADDEDSDY
jgi:DNA-binding ferritin-like protein